MSSGDVEPMTDDAFDDWEWETRLALGERGIWYNEATPLIEDARTHHEQSGGEDPWQVLGTPEEFAADVAADRPAGQARRDTQGKTARDHLGDAAFIIACLAVPAALIAALAQGSWTISFNVAGLTGSILLCAVVLAGQTPDALRAAGYPRLAPWGFVVSGVLVVAGGAAFTLLTQTHVGQVPVLGVFAVSLIVCWLQTRPGKPRIPPQPMPTDDMRDPSDAEAWFVRLRGVLIGRFDVPTERAAALVAETRAHVAAADTTPQQEFPSLAHYALELAAGEPTRRLPWWRDSCAAVRRAALRR